MEFRFALEDCDKCIKLDPTFVKGYIRRGMALQALHEPERAMKAFEEALRLDPNSAVRVIPRTVGPKDGWVQYCIYRKGFKRL